MLLPATGWSAEVNGKKKRERKKLKLGWKTFTTALLEKHSVQIKQVPVCEECNNRFRGTLPSFFFFLFLILHAFCHLVCCKTSCPFWSCRLLFLHLQQAPPLSFSFPLFVSLSLSLVMSLSRRESLGYQCSATDRKRMINKLSCFSSPLYPPPFFFWNEDSRCSQRHFSSFPPPSLLIIPPSLLFFPVEDGRESQVCDNNYTYTQKKIMSFSPFNKFAVE